MEGYYLEYRDKKLPPLKNCNLVNRYFDNSMLKEFIDLFDGAYYELNMDNDWDTNSYALHEKQFQQNYITDIVVSPRYQTYGYGTYILAHCIRTMRTDKFIDKIRIRVAKSNIGAKKLYERNGFDEIACFAEHTYVCNDVCK